MAVKRDDVSRPCIQMDVQTRSRSEGDAEPWPCLRIWFFTSGAGKDEFFTLKFKASRIIS